MDSYLGNSKQAIIVLHEIYGVNEFIKDQCVKLKETGFDVFCPNMIDKPPFSYDESIEAYDFFTKNVGFEDKYDNVFIIGYSIGATIAWRCCEKSLCSGIIACYGSRIRDYTHLNPTCPTLLLFAKEATFDVHAMLCQLRDKQRLAIIEIDAEHGFLDHYSKHYNIQQSKFAEESIARFINECSK